MDLQGKGTELQKDINAALNGGMQATGFRDKYSDGLYSIVEANFILPVMVDLVTSNKSMKDKQEKAELISNKISLFCAAFI